MAMFWGGGAECAKRSNIVPRLVFMNVGCTYILRPMLGSLDTERCDMPSHNLLLSDVCVRKLIFFLY
jgi:hypothetical protein